MPTGHNTTDFPVCLTMRALIFFATVTFPFVANNGWSQVLTPEELPPQRNTRDFGRQLERISQPLRVTDITLESAQLKDELPTDDSTDLFQPAVESDNSQTRGWAATEYFWAPTNIAYHPLYFEQAAVERYGRTVWPFGQPILSAGCFYGAFLAWPAQIVCDCPWSCYYAYGYPPPGTPACCCSGQ